MKFEFFIIYELPQGHKQLLWIVLAGKNSIHYHLFWLWSMLQNQVAQKNTNSQKLKVISRNISKIKLIFDKIAT